MFSLVSEWKICFSCFDSIFMFTNNCLNGLFSFIHCSKDEINVRKIIGNLDVSRLFYSYIANKVDLVVFVLAHGLRFNNVFLNVHDFSWYAVVFHRFACIKKVFFECHSKHRISLYQIKHKIYFDNKKRNEFLGNECFCQCCRLLL